MAKVSSRGTCILCSKSFSKSGMTRHLKSCRENNQGSDGGSGRRPGRKRQGFHLAVEGLHRPQFWMHLEIDGNAQLWELDHFLRRTWLECCGHLSAFVIRGRNHFLEDRDIWADLDDLDMDVALKETLRPGMKFTHEYDFGDTTELGLRVVSEGNVSVASRGVLILAQNDPPEISCLDCDAPAVRICTECYWGQAGFFYCDQCAEQHTAESPSHDEMFLPVVNSPRMGQCGYTGPDDDMFPEYSA